MFFILENEMPLTSFVSQRVFVAGDSKKKIIRPYLFGPICYRASYHPL